MTKSVDTAFERHFSEPPVVAVKEGRTHCEACKEPLDPTVMHKCHGNQEYQAPTVSATDITEICPAPGCVGDGVLVESQTIHGGAFVVVCDTCGTYAHPLVVSRETAIESWNAAPRNTGGLTFWPKWLAHLPGDDERANVIQSDAKPSHPDLANYRGACPAVHVEGETCDWCENTGTIPPTKPEGAQ